MIGDAVMYGAGIALLVCILVGLIKTPFLKHKSKAWFKPTFTFITVSLTIAVVGVVEVFLLKGQLVTAATVTLLIATFSEIYGLYNVLYEGTHLRAAMTKLVNYIKKAVAAKPEGELAKSVKKMTKAVKKLESKGMDLNVINGMLNSIFIELKNTQTSTNIENK